MSARSARRTLTRRLLAREARLFAVFAITLLLCTSIVVLLDGLRSSGARAEEQSAYGHNAGYELTLEVADPDAARQLDAAGLTKLITSVAEVTIPGGRLDVSLIASTDPQVAQSYGVERGSLDTDRPGVAVSATTADTLGLQLGDTVELTGEGITGTRDIDRIFSIPNDPDLALAVAAVPVEPPGATRWLLDREDLNDPAIGPLLDDETLDYSLRSSSGLAAERTDVLETGRFASITYIGPFGVLLTLAAWTSVVTLTRSRMLAHVDALAALGLRPSEARSVLRKACVAAAAAGALIGTAAGVGAILLLYSVLGRLADQAWQTGAASASRTATYLLASLVGVLVITELVIRDSPPRSRSRGRLQLSTTARSALGATGLVGAGVAYIAGDLRWINPYVAALACGLALLLAAVGASNLIVAARASNGPKRIVTAARRSSPTAWVAALVAAAIAFSGSFLAANAHSELVIGRDTYRPAQPPSSIVVDQADTATTTLIAQTWAQLTDQAIPWTFALPDEDAVEVRVSTPEFVTCAASSGVELGAQDCPEPAGAFINPTRVALGAANFPTWDPTTAPVLADDQLIVDGRIGLIATTVNGEIVDTWIVDALPDQTLGNLLPGVIIGPDTQLAADLDLSASAYNRIALDGADLTPDELDQVAATIAALAPAATIAVERGYDDGGLTAFTLFFAIGSAAVAAAMLVVFGLGLIDSTRPLRRVIHSLGATRGTRWLVATVMLSDAATAIIAIPIALFATAALWTDQTSWLAAIVLAPTVVAATCVVGALVRLAREPSMAATSDR